MPKLESFAANDETLGQEEESQHDHLTSTDQPQPSYQSTSHHHHHRHHHHNHSIPTDEQPARTGPPPLTRVRSFYTPYMEDKLRRRLKYFFMGPHEKVKAKKKCPWKLLIQVAKIILVTWQLIQFGYNRSSFVEFTEKSTRAMQHLYLKDWTNSYETMPYPPAIGKYAIYSTEEIISYVDYAMKNHDKTESSAIGSFRFDRENNMTTPMHLCLKSYKSGTINDITNSYTIDSTVVTTCYNVSSLSDGTYNITQFMWETYNKTIDYDTLLILELRFSLKLFRLEMTQRTFPPQLFKVEVIISLDDSNKDGQMLVTLKSDLSEIDIEGKSDNDAVQYKQKVGYVVLDSFVILVTALSIGLCGRSVWRAQSLRRETNTFFKQRFGQDLSASDHCEFINLWYVTIIINDVLTLVGTGLKIQLETRNLKSSSNNFDYCGLMLGTGSLLAWLGILRYIGFFSGFNILIVTLKKAFPNMLRFLACCMLLYIGFVICGWVVLGPYHIKFREMSTASECLFSLINGDDMFVTFSATVTNSGLVWYYSRFYLYIFISLFIYAVLNLFIAVILDTYETIKEYYEHGFPKSELFKFVDQCEDPAHSPIYRREDESCSLFSALACCCCCGKNPDQPNEYTRIG